jgi:hypothetical protein
MLKQDHVRFLEHDRNQCDCKLILRDIFGQVLYRFAVAMRNVASRPRFAIQGLANAQGDVFGEERSVNIRNGRLEDDFAGCGVHFTRFRCPDLEFESNYELFSRLFAMAALPGAGF